jgi:hypothetical protein
MAVISGSRVTDERVTWLRIFADANGETHMKDVDIALHSRNCSGQSSTAPLNPLAICKAGQLLTY